MEAASPARLYAATAGALLIVLGIVGFFYSASFGSPGTVDAAAGAFRCNGWVNLAHIATGALGLLLADTAPRGYSLVVGALYTAFAIWGFSVGAGVILALFPGGVGNSTLHLSLGVLGLLAAAATPRPRSRGLETRPDGT